MDDKDKRIRELEARVASLTEELNSTKAHLKQYTAPSYKREYYENNKDKLLEKMKTNQVSQEKRREYNQRAYQRRKEKLKSTQDAPKLV